MNTNQIAFELHNEIGSLVKSQLKGEIKLAQKLHDIKRGEFYKEAVGQGIDTWVDYLRQPEVNITPYRASKLIRLYEHFILGLGYQQEQLEGVPTFALDFIARKGLLDVVGINTLIDDARALSEKDWKDKYHDDIEGGARTYTYLIMRKCVETGRLEKVHDIPSDEIIEKFHARIPKD